MKFRQNLRNVAIGVAATVSLLAAVPAYIIIWNPRLLDQFIHPPHLSDRDLIANFHRHHAEFEQLRDMILRDKGLLRVTSDLTWPEDPQTIGIPSSRIAEYRGLLKKLGIQGGIAVSSDQENIELTTSFRGFITHGSQKGYLYTSESTPKYLVAGLDRFSQSGVGGGWVHVDGNWYLFFEGY